MVDRRYDDRSFDDGTVSGPIWRGNRRVVQPSGGELCREEIKKEENKIAQRLKEALETASDAKSAEVEEALALKRRAERVREARKILLERLAEKSREASEKKKQELVEKEKVNITDPDAHIV